MDNQRKRNKSSNKYNSNESDFNSYLSENSISKQNNLLNILTKSFKPLIDNAYKKYINDNYSPVVKKIETDKLHLTGKKTEMELLYEKYFKKSLSRPSSPKKSPRKNSPKRPPLKRKQSFLIENNIIDKKDILNNPCNKKYIRICKTPDNSRSLQKEFYEREKIFKKNKEVKKNEMKNFLESKMLSEMKPTPGIYLGSQRILEKNNLDKRAPLHMRFKEVLGEKNVKLKSIQRNLKRDFSANSISAYNTINNSNMYNNIPTSKRVSTQEDINNCNLNYNSNISTNNYNTNFSIKNNNINNLNRANSAIGFGRSRSFNTREFGNWLESNSKWHKLKEARTENMKNLFDKVNKENEEKYTKFSPTIDVKSEYIAKLKNQNENPNVNIYDKLYSLHSKKKENIQNLQQKYKPSFKPNVNKFPQYLMNNTINQNTTKSFYIEEKEDDYANFISGVKNKLRTDNSSTKPGSKNEKFLTKENIEFGKFEKEVEKNFYLNQNKKNYKKSKKEIEDFFFQMNKGISPNYGLEINDIKFYNEIHKN